ncbi:hypothetical protein ACVWZL_007279 [Bradyrhizobium sp. GM2.4]
MIRSGADQITSSRLVEWSHFRLVAGVGVGLPVAPGEQHRQGHHGDDNQEHQDGGDDDKVALLRRDIAGRRQHDVVAAT